MLTKRITASIAVLLSAATLSAPTFADNGYHRGHGHVAYYPQHVVVQRPVVVRPVYPVVYHRPAPRPVVVVQQQPVYHSNAGLALIAGAILGAAIVHSATGGY
jgi:hypothetical protein